MPSSIESLLSELENEFALHAFIGLECEFYVAPALDDAAFEKLQTILQNTTSLLNKLEREDGEGQLEFSLHYTSDIALLLEQLATLKYFLHQQPHNANFSAKPFDAQPASGLHLHIHLETKDGARAYYKDDGQISEPLADSIAGLLSGMPEAAKALIINEADRARIQSAALDTPSTISWGANNRSCAIRLPDQSPNQKHIEYRLAGADADLECVIEHVLKGILHGLRNKPALPNQIYGNASDAQYGLDKLVS